MVKSYSTQVQAKGNRAEDKLSLSNHIAVMVAEVQRVSKKSAVVYAAQCQAARFRAARKKLELELVKAMSYRPSGFIARVKNMSVVRSLKAKLNEINQKIVSWLNATAAYYDIKFAA